MGAVHTCGLVTRMGGLERDGCLVWAWLETLEPSRKVPPKSLSFLPLKSRPSLPNLRSFLPSLVQAFFPSIQDPSKTLFLPSKPSVQAFPPASQDPSKPPKPSQAVFSAPRLSTKAPSPSIKLHQALTSAPSSLHKLSQASF